MSGQTIQASGDLFLATMRSIYEAYEAACQRRKAWALKQFKQFRPGVAPLVRPREESPPPRVSSSPAQQSHEETAALLRQTMTDFAHPANDAQGTTPSAPAATTHERR